MKPKKPRTKKAQTKPLYQGSRPIAFGGVRLVGAQLRRGTLYFPPGVYRAAEFKAAVEIFNGLKK